MTSSWPPAYHCSRSHQGDAIGVFSLRSRHPRRVADAESLQFATALQLPDFERPVIRDGNRTLTVRHHGHGHDLPNMAEEGLQLATALQLPHRERLIIRGGNRALTVGRHDHGVDPASVAGQGLQLATALQLPDLEPPVRRGGNRALTV